MKDHIFYLGSMIIPENRIYLERPRIHNLLQSALESPIITISAGAGYGKTQAVYSFLQKYDMEAIWMQFSERDNLKTHFWENCTATVAMFDGQFAARLQEIGFPETEEQFVKYFSLAESKFSPDKRELVVFDDFHLIRDRSVLQFFRRFAHASSPKRTTILISRTEPDIGMIGLLSKGLVVHIGEEDLRFTEKETAQYFQILDIPLSSQNVSEIYNDTGGWPFALHLVGLSLKKVPHHEQMARASMKLNIFRMIENEIFLDVPEKLQRFLIRLSLIDYLSEDLVSILAGDDTLVDEMEQISSFIHRDIYTNAYQIHRLFRDYLQQRQSILTEEERRDTWLKAARWCEKNDYRMDAVSYYNKAEDYESIVWIVCRSPMQIPFNEAKTFLDVYSHAPPGLLEQIAPYHFQHSRLLLSAGRYDEAITEINERVKKYSALPPSDFNNRVLSGAYLALGIAGYLMLPWTDRCDFDVLLEKADHYYCLSPYEESGLVTSVSLDAWASRVGTARKGAMEEYIETLTRAIPHAANVLNGFMYGLDDLAEGELRFYQGDLKIAEQLIRQALKKAEAQNQYGVRNRALFYLLRIGVAKGDFEKIQNALEHLEMQLGMNDPSRFITYDIVLGWYYSLLGRPQFIVNWLKSDFTKGTLAFFHENFGNFIKTKICYAGKRYHELLSFLEKTPAPHATLFEKLEMKVLEAVCEYQIPNKDASLSALKEAYDLALPNGLTMPFIELGKDMRTLTAAAMRKRKCGLPREWLEMIHRKSMTYAKRLTLVISKYEKANDTDKEWNAALSSREIEVLNDLYQGLSRSEIAAAHGLSINTVKMIGRSVYSKLGGNNLVDVIRIALERKLIK
jgi:LuxR family maltose regulon positive regulatory protein